MKILPEEKKGSYLKFVFVHLDKKDMEKIFYYFEDVDDLKITSENNKNKLCEFDDWNDLEKNGKKEPQILTINANSNLYFGYQYNKALELGISQRTNKENESD